VVGASNLVWFGAAAVVLAVTAVVAVAAAAAANPCSGCPNEKAIATNVTGFKIYQIDHNLTISRASKFCSSISAL
jgi:hypothetical protein